MLYRLTVGLLLLLPSLALANAARINEAKTLLESGAAEPAYQILDSLAATTSGVEFDYLLGIAALDAGHPGVAVFAFERVLAANPQHVYARAELGRALFRLGDYEDALAEFERVRDLNAPPEILDRLARYEAALKEERGSGYRAGAFIEAMIGYDSNYASATDDQTVSIPAFGNLVFNLDNLFTEDGSLTVGARSGAYVLKPLTRNMSLVANLNLDGADYPDSDAGFFFINLRGNIGLRHRYDNRSTFSLAATGFSTWVSEFNYLHSYGVTGSWRYDASQRDSVTTFFRVADLNYDDVVDFRDATQYLGGMTITRIDSRGWGLGLGVHGGAEIEARDTRRDIGRELYGVRGFGHYNLTPKLRLSAEVAGQFSDYRAPDPLFLRTRDDEQLRTRLALNYTINRDWSIRPEVRYTNNNSSLPTNDYERYETIVFVRRNFD